MIEDEQIIELFFHRSEAAIRELDIKYGKVYQKLSYNIVNNRQDAEECVNDAYLGTWNAIPPAKPEPLLTYVCKIVRNISLKIYYRKEAAKRSNPLQEEVRQKTPLDKVGFPCRVPLSGIGRSVYRTETHAAFRYWHNTAPAR